jgi:D-threonate/D-erythronate kinase
MFVVLADDFSGAAEIAGIGHRYGLKSEVQLSLESNSTADLIALDTDTRSASEADAVKKISEISAGLRQWNKPIRLFKKIDSVMRGHLIPEINALHQHLGFNNVLLMSANPSRGRKIVDGKYFVNDVPLHQTVFADDPDFPVTSSEIVTRVKAYWSELRHVHLQPGDTLPSAAIITGDAATKDDLKKYIAGIGSETVCCGAANLFESFLEHFGYTTNVGVSTSAGRKYLLIINGSTVRNVREKKWFETADIIQVVMPGGFNDGVFELTPSQFTDWRNDVFDKLYHYRRVALAIEHPPQHNKLLSEKFLNYFVELVQYITENIATADIHFCLTGGATASAIIRRLDEGKLWVKGEVVPGVVSLVSHKNGRTGGCFTVKPGSYEWPEQLFDLSPKGK